MGYSRTGRRPPAHDGGAAALLIPRGVGWSSQEVVPVRGGFCLGAESWPDQENPKGFGVPDGH